MYAIWEGDALLYYTNDADTAAFASEAGYIVVRMNQ